MVVSRETPILEKYREELLRWDRRISLIGPDVRAELNQHIRHDAELLSPYLTAHSTFLDVGTGNGLPAIPALILANECPRETIFVEADLRKAAFLRAMRRELKLRYEVLGSRVENIPDIVADIVSAKAFAPLHRLLDLCVPHLAPAGRILAFKGRSAEEEIAKARQTWDFGIERGEPNARTGAVLLIISEPRRRVTT